MSDSESEAKLRELAERYLQVPIHRFLGARIDSLSREGCAISFETAEQLLTPANTLHAGAIYTALELANVFAILPHLNENETAMSIQHSVSLIGTVAGSNKRVIVRSRMLKRGASIAFFESETFDAENMSILAKGKTTKAVKKLKPKKSPTEQHALRPKELAISPSSRQSKL